MKSNFPHFTLASAEDLGLLVHKLRVERQLTQSDLAARVGVSVRLVREMELGARDVRMSRVLQLLNRLGFDLEAVGRQALREEEHATNSASSSTVKRVRRKRNRNPANGT